MLEVVNDFPQPSTGQAKGFSPEMFHYSVRRLWLQGASFTGMGSDVLQEIPRGFEAF